MSDQNLRSRLIRLAHLHPEVREAILPLLETSPVQKSASSASPVPLTSEQKSFLKDLAAALNGILRQHVDGSKPNYFAQTSYQTDKPYKKDGFGRNSILTGIPHAKIELFISATKDGRELGGLPSCEFLLSADGATAIMKADTPWGRGVKPMTSREIGTAWGNSIAVAISRALRLNQTVLVKQQEMDVETQRKQEEAQKREEIRKQEEARRQELEAAKLLLSGGGKGYIFHTKTQMDNDEDDPRNNNDRDILPISDIYNDTLQLATMSEVSKNLYREYHWFDLKNDSFEARCQYERKYNTRGVYGLTRVYSETITITRADGKPFNEVEKEYIRTNFLVRQAKGSLWK